MMALYDPRKNLLDPLKSPCVRNCCLDDEDVCMGCGRTLDEIRSWTSLDDNRRREVLALAEARRRQRDPSARS